MLALLVQPLEAFLRRIIQLVQPTTGGGRRDHDAPIDALHLGVQVGVLGQSLEALLVGQ